MGIVDKLGGFKPDVLAGKRGPGDRPRSLSRRGRVSWSGGPGGGLETDDIGRGKQINILSPEEGLDAFVVVVRTRDVAEAALPTLINKLQQCIPSGGIGVVDRKRLLPLIENDENYGLHGPVQRSEEHTSETQSLMRKS